MIGFISCQGVVVTGVDTVIGQSVLKVADAIIKDDAPLILSSLEDAASWLKEHKVSTSNLEVVKNAFSIIEKRSRSIIDNANRCDCPYFRCNRGESCAHHFLSDSR